MRPAETPADAARCRGFPEAASFEEERYFDGVVGPGLFGGCIREVDAPAAGPSAVRGAFTAEGRRRGVVPFCKAASCCQAERFCCPGLSKEEAKLMSLSCHRSILESKCSMSCLPSSPRIAQNSVDKTTSRMAPKYPCRITNEPSGTGMTESTLTYRSQSVLGLGLTDNISMTLPARRMT